MDTYEHIRLPLDEDYDDLGNPRSSPLASDTKRQIIMNQDFSRVQAMNAMSTRPNFRRKSRKGLRFTVVVLLLLSSVGVYYADQVDKVWNDTISYSQLILGLF